jgi:hypothetical protein
MMRTPDVRTIVIGFVLWAGCAQQAHAIQANTVNNTQPGANGTATCTGTNSNATQAVWYLGGYVVYSKTPHPWIPNYVTYAFNTQPAADDLSAPILPGAGYTDARVRVLFSVYEYHTTSGAQTVISEVSSSEGTLPPEGRIAIQRGPSPFQVDTAWYRVRYKVRDGINTPSSGAAWTGDL